MDNVELRGWVKCGRRRLWQCHSTDPGFARKTVNPATVFAQGAIFQIIIFHLKDDENHQLLIMDSTILSYHPQFSIFHQRPVDFYRCKKTQQIQK